MHMCEALLSLLIPTAFTSFNCFWIFLQICAIYSAYTEGKTEKDVLAKWDVY